MIVYRDSMTAQDETRRWLGPVCEEPCVQCLKDIIQTVGGSENFLNKGVISDCDLRRQYWGIGIERRRCEYNLGVIHVIGEELRQGQKVGGEQMQLRCILTVDKT